MSSNEDTSTAENTPTDGGGSTQHAPRVVVGVSASESGRAAPTSWSSEPATASAPRF